MSLKRTRQMWKAEEPMSKKIVESMCEDDTFALGKELGKNAGQETLFF